MYTPCDGHLQKNVIFKYGTPAEVLKEAHCAISDGISLHSIFCLSENKSRTMLVPSIEYIFVICSPYTYRRMPYSNTLAEVFTKVHFKWCLSSLYPLSIAE